MRELRWCCCCQRVSEVAAPDEVSDGRCPHCGALPWSMLSWYSARGDNPEWPSSPPSGSRFPLYDDNCWRN